MRSVEITETLLRDAHQSLMATRMSIEDMLPVLSSLDKVGYYSLECWGGATFDACLRFLNEDPWERLRTLKKHLPNTKLQMLLRGQNLLGYRHYSDDVVDKFVELSAENGIDVFRIFDALNDTRNLQRALDAVKRTGKEAQLCISYTTSPVHTVDYYIELTKQMVAMGTDSICIKDMAGVLTPRDAKALISGMKLVTNLPIILHTHATSGISEMTYHAAVEAGVDRIDTALSPFSGGTSQPATESLYLALKDEGYDVSLDEKLMEEIAVYMRSVRQKYLDNGTMSPTLLFADPRTLIYQVPGGMLSNMLSQLKQAGAESKLDQVLSEVPKVRKDMGYPPLVTPMSQIVGTQAAMNIILGERYKMVSKEVKQYLIGEYGKSPVPVDPEFAKSIIGDAEIYTGRPADRLEPEFDKLREEIGELAKSDEDVLIYALFPNVAKDFLTKKYAPNEEVIRVTGYVR
ncbi:oxaloacetate decarboxylase subunit alpha [Streptococcus sp. S784/96/1]|uniref:oxaloacetate decarboxylase subunit alpha n=1 Tax=Streptococcus sp. S784/96/1 TaxID=2653499 RepID=UPI001386B458|nr:oxaloacetate decarboxylase subunit alpha [Streptococcus sp. S784/96/1]